MSENKFEGTNGDKDVIPDLILGKHRDMRMQGTWFTNCPVRGPQRKEELILNTRYFHTQQLMELCDRQKQMMENLKEYIAYVCFGKKLELYPQEADVESKARQLMKAGWPTETIVSEVLRQMLYHWTFDKYDKERGHIKGFLCCAMNNALFYLLQGVGPAPEKREVVVIRRTKGGKAVGTLGLPEAKAAEAKTETTVPTSEDEDWMLKFYSNN